MLDLLGAMALLAESGSHVAGSIDTNKGNHSTDLHFLQKLKPLAHQMYPDLEFLAEPSPTVPNSFFFFRFTMARRSASYDRPEL
jgi:hypothetical protein